MPLLITGAPPPLTGMTPAMTVETRVHDGCDACDGFVHGLSRPLAPPCPAGAPSPEERVPQRELPIHPAYLSYPSSVPSCDVMVPSYPSLAQPNEGATPPETVLLPLCAVCGETVPASPVMEALVEETVGVELAATDGVSQNGIPAQHAMDHVPISHCNAQFTETPTGWPLARCACADPSGTEQPPPCAVCGGTERWEHAGVWRCVTCWPWEGHRTHARADTAMSTTRTTRGDPAYTTDEA
jgi:hypothetical protein